MSKISEPTEDQLFKKYLIQGFLNLVWGPTFVIILLFLLFLYSYLSPPWFLSLMIIILLLGLIGSLIQGIYQIIIYKTKPEKKRAKLLEKWKKKHAL